MTAGQVYGFRLSGSNYDTNNLLRGTFTLSTRPYLEALGQVGDNRDWTQAIDITDGEALPAKRTLGQSGEARWFKFPVKPNEDVSAALSGIPTGEDYDLALYGDICLAFERLCPATT